jgi:hypothetical protein
VTGQEERALCSSVDTPSHSPLAQHSSTPLGTFKIGLLNARSMMNKANNLREIAIDNELRIFAITETWHKSNTDPEINELCPSDFQFKGIPRPSEKGKCGGGIGAIYKSSIQTEMKHGENYRTFEYMNINMKLQPPILLCVLYKVHSKDNYRFSTNDFFEEFELYLTSIISSTVEDICIIGDINIHLDDETDPSTKRIKNILESLGLKQHVKHPTHNGGHTLDAVITRTDAQWISSPDVKTTIESDHSLITFIVNRPSPPSHRILKGRRILSSLDVDAFCSDIHLHQHLSSNEADTNGDELVTRFNTAVTKALDKHAPTKDIKLKGETSKKWYDDEVHMARRKRRKLERKYLKSKLTIDKEIFEAHSKEVARLIDRKKTAYYKEQFLEADSKETFRLLNGLLAYKNADVLPLRDGGSNADLAKSFADYFEKKVQDIHDSLGNTPLNIDDEEDIGRPRHITLSDYSIQTIDDIAKIIRHSPSKSCSLDPLPTWLLKKPQVLDLLLPAITTIINESLSTSHVPQDFKTAVVFPTLKKDGLDPNILGNYRPVSNLPFISKVLEKVVAAQITNFLKQHHLFDPLQSAYRTGHSTESALIKVKTDADLILDEGDAMLLVLLDLSAAFDTLDHSILLRRIERTVGINGNALDWIKSYLTERRQRVHINDDTSQSAILQTGVPQGSVLGPLLFILYMLPLTKIIAKNNVSRHSYADDTQLYIRLRLQNDQNIKDDVATMEKCLDEVKLWMSQNRLKLNEKKTEVLIIATKHQRMKVANIRVKIGENVIQPTEYVRNLGGYFDQDLTMKHQVTTTIRACYFHLRRISKIRKHIDDDTCAKIINATITSRMDYHNGLLSGCHENITRPLQLLQNNCARLLKHLRRRDHITPALCELHWLPIKFRSDFKIMYFIHNALHEEDSPLYIKDTFQSYIPNRQLRSTNDPWKLVPTTTNHYHGHRSVVSHGVSLWNSLPANIRGPMSKTVFKKKLKTVLFSRAYDVNSVHRFNT